MLQSIYCESTYKCIYSMSSVQFKTVNSSVFSSAIMHIYFSFTYMLQNVWIIWFLHALDHRCPWNTCVLNRHIASMQESLYRAKTSTGIMYEYFMQPHHVCCIYVCLYAFLVETNWDPWGCSYFINAIYWLLLFLL